MSNRYKGGVLSATPPTTSSSAAPGIWTLEQQMQATAGTGWPFGGPFTYIEDVFSTYLYTGNNSTQTIVNGIDLSGKGGLVWNKSRNQTYYHNLYDTTRGVNNRLFSNTSDAASTTANTLTSFNSNGFTIGNSDTGNFPPIGNIGVSWTFRKQPKFFDVVTYTGNGTTQNIAHSLGGTVGCIIVKNASSVNNWQTWHRGLTSGYRILLNSTGIETNVAIASVFGNNSTYVAPTSTQFTVGQEGAVNQSGETMVAYLFAHNAGGFGLTGTDNVISCGSYTGVTYPGDVAVTLGYEPQWVMVKNTTQASDWVIYDNMRGMTAGTSAAGFSYLAANLTAAENVGSAPGISPTATGFIARAGLTAVSGSAGDTMVYIAIRRGPMKLPTLGTTVFAPALGSGTAPGYVSGFPVDLGIERNKGSAANTEAGSRLTGATVLQTNSTATEANSTNTKFDYMNGFFAGTKGTSEIAWMFRRAPGFFDIVCYTGTGAVQNIAHNLTVVPELIITKNRSNASNWRVYSAALGNTKYLTLNGTQAEDTLSSMWNNTTPTSSVFTVGTSNGANAQTYIAYLFATCAGVSKVGSYTGTATTKQIDCGFTAGSRFVLIKRTDSTGDWYVYDSARGIVSGNDPYLLLDSTAAETTGTDYVDTYNAGFELSSTAPADLNANGGTYIFLAIA